MHSTPIQVRFNDADALGHINNAVYLSYFDMGKTDYFSNLHKQCYYTEPIDIIIAHIDIDFKAQGMLHEPLEVRTEITHIGNKSMNIHQQVVNSETGEVKCDGNTVMVGYDFAKHCTARISDRWRNAINKVNNE
ncbi:MAG: acyl-CoA thioesterase [Paludibacteraceae bacterium]|nr:acyl-CoA thioesterase [Paludibacteraceae bacterium]